MKGLLLDRVDRYSAVPWVLGIGNLTLGGLDARKVWVYLLLRDQAMPVERLLLMFAEYPAAQRRSSFQAVWWTREAP